jgi:hypothetical protein
MSNPTRFRSKVLRQLNRALDNETSYIRRYFWIGKGCAFLGGLAFGLALFAALRARIPWGTWFVCVGAAGGLLIGFGVFMGSSIRQWPVVREFLNVEELRKAARDHEV